MQTPTIHTKTRPVLYLDVDGVLLMFPENQTAEWWKRHPRGGAAPGAKRFLLWAIMHMDVRWLTSWCLRGHLDDTGAAQLAQILDVSPHLLHAIHNPQGWRDNKTEGIDFSTDFYVLEDEILPREREIMEKAGKMDRWWFCDTSKNPFALLEAWNKLVKVVE